MRGAAQFAPGVPRPILLVYALVTLAVLIGGGSNFWASGQYAWNGWTVAVTLVLAVLHLLASLVVFVVPAAVAYSDAQERGHPTPEIASGVSVLKRFALAIFVTLLFWYVLSQRTIPRLMHTFTAGPAVVQQVNIVAAKANRSGKGPDTYWVEIEDVDGSRYEMKVDFEIYQRLEHYNGPADAEIRRSWFGVEALNIAPPN